MDSNLDPDSTIPIIVSYDGTWHKRGHSSHYGVGVVIELYTGLVIDTHVVSNYCAKCVKRPDPNDPKYEQWCTTHAPECIYIFGECGMFVMCCMQCCMSVSAVL